MHMHKYVTTRFEKNRFALLSAVLIAGLLASLSLTANAHSLWIYTGDAGTGGQQSGDTQTAPPSQLTVTINNQGMTQSSGTVAAGMVHLRVENPNGLEDLKLRVSRESGELVREISVADKAGELETELDLSAGQYVLSEESHTTWTCRITAQAPPNSGGSAGGPFIRP